jgi:hypothetical protein
VKVVFVTTRSERYRLAWRLFQALERNDTAFIEAITDSSPSEDLPSGMGLVAARLRDALEEHAREVGCDCGSDRWLEEEAIHQQAIEDDDG